MGVGFFLGILNPGKALPTPRGRRPLLLPPSALSRARHAGPIRSRGPGGCLRGGAPRTVPSAPRSWWRSRRTPHPTRPGLGGQGTEGFPRRGSWQPGVPSLFPSVNRTPRVRAAPPSAHQSLAPTTTQESTAAAVAALLTAPRSRPGRDKRRGRGGEGGSLAPPPHWAVAFSTHPLGSAPIASPTANGSKPQRQMTRKYVTGARRAALGAESGAGSTAPSADRRQRGRPTGKGKGSHASWFQQGAVELSLFCNSTLLPPPLR